MDMGALIFGGIIGFIIGAAVGALIVVLLFAAREAERSILEEKEAAANKIRATELKVATNLKRVR